MREIKETIAQAAAGNLDAFEELVLKYQSIVWSLARRFLHDPTLADEVAQDVFMELFRNITVIKSGEHLLFWLRKVTSHRCIDRARRERTHLHVNLDETSELDKLQITIIFADPLLSNKLQNAIAELPATARMIIILRFQQDLEPAEISNLLEMPVNTVKSHLRRGIIALREKLPRSFGGAFV